MPSGALSNVTFPKKKVVIVGGGLFNSSETLLSHLSGLRSADDGSAKPSPVLARIPAEGFF